MVLLYLLTPWFWAVPSEFAVSSGEWAYETGVRRLLHRGELTQIPGRTALRLADTLLPKRVFVYTVAPLIATMQADYLETLHQSELARLSGQIEEQERLLIKAEVHQIVEHLQLCISLGFEFFGWITRNGK